MFVYKLLGLVIGYGIGCVQSAYIVGKINKIDIREHGSGNAGTTNVMRTLGAKAGITVFLLDFLKGLLSVLIIGYIFQNFLNIESGKVFGLYSGIGTILGHNFPFYLKFKGGKGIACSMGVICGVNIWFGLIVCIIGLFIAIVSKYVSLGSICAAVIAPIMLIVFDSPLEINLLVTAVALLAIFQHRANIKRLATGTENKFTIKKKG